MPGHHWTAPAANVPCKRPAADDEQPRLKKKGLRPPKKGDEGLP